MGEWLANNVEEIQGAMLMYGYKILNAINVYPT